ncbi:MAG: hypothetical protein AB1473_11390 [Thermodesulfobacteriota bacterium]
MDDVQKSKIRLKHWIDHNQEHLKGYWEVADLLDRHGQVAASGPIRRAIGLIEEANREFSLALDSLGGSGETPTSDAEHREHGHHHHGSGHHSRDHKHEHDE